METPSGLTRRNFLKDGLAAAVVVGSGVQLAGSAVAAAQKSGLPWRRQNGTAAVTIDAILDHDVVVIE